MGLTAAVTLPLVGIGVAAAKAALDVDKGMDIIRIGTGAVGEALKSLEGSAKAVAKTVPQNIQAVSQAIADLNTRTGLTGPALERMAKMTLDAARMMGIDSAELVASFTRTLGDWGIELENAPAALDTLFATSQATGVGLDQLNRSIVQYGAPLRQMGFDFETAAALVGKFEKEGVNAELVMGSLRIALGTMAREGKPVVETFRAVMEQIKATADTSEANRMALELFGARAGPDMAAAIREGRFEIDSLVKSLRASGGAVRSASDDTRGFAEIWAETKNKVILALEPLGKIFLAFAENWLPKIASVVEAVAGAFARLPGPAKAALIIFGLLAATLGPVLIVAAKLILIAPAMGAAWTLLAGPIGLVALALVGFVAAATAAHKVMSDLIKAKERAIDADNALFESQQKLGQKLREAADAAGMTRREFVALTEKYNGNTAALAMAIKKGQEGKELQEALAAVGAKHKEIIDEQRRAQEQGAAAQEKANLALAQSAEQIKLVTSIRQQLTDEVKRATLKETEYQKWALKAAYENRVEEIGKEVTDEKTRGELLLAARKSYHAQLAALEKSFRDEELQGRIDFGKQIREQEQQMDLDRIEALKTYVLQRQAIQDGINQMTMTALQYKLLNIEKERMADATHIAEMKGISEQRRAEDLASSAAYYAQRKALAEADASAEVALVEATQAALTGVYMTGIENILGAFQAFGEGTKTILGAVGSAFKATVNACLSALKQLVAGVLASAAKIIFAKQAEALAGVIASVMKSIPFPLNLILVGGAIAAVSALFSAIKLGEGGVVMGPTLALVGEAGPEMVVPLHKLGAFAERDRRPAAVAAMSVNLYAPMIQTTGLSRREIDRAAADLFEAVDGQARRWGFSMKRTG